MDQAAQMLTIELASKISNDSTNIKAASNAECPLELELTEDQKALGISLPLVYLAGLLYCIASNSNRNKSRRKSAASQTVSSSLVDLEKRFIELQKIYNNACGCEHQIFSLSPRLIPNTDQQTSIQRDYTSKLKQLESKADDVAKQLLGIDQKEKQRKKQKGKQTEKERNKDYSNNKAKKPDVEGDGEIINGTNLSNTKIIDNDTDSEIVHDDQETQEIHVIQTIRIIMFKKWN